MLRIAEEITRKVSAQGKDGAGANEDTHPDLRHIGVGRQSYVPAYVYEVARSCSSVNHRLRLRRQ